MKYKNVSAVTKEMSAGSEEVLASGRKGYRSQPIIPVVRIL